jgi:L-iditol 2-dehydrogenase
MVRDVMRAARLHGVEDLRVEELPTPEPGSGELLVRVEACGVCPTDVRKYLIGVNDGEYPFNPGHEWVGHVAAVGTGVEGFVSGQRVYGDTYAGYAEYALLAVEPGAWSAGPVPVPDGLPADRAVFVEPLADCLHAVRDQARVEGGDLVVVVGAGQMGAQLVACAAQAGARVLAVEPMPERGELARVFGAASVVTPAQMAEAVADLSAGAGADAVILSIGLADQVAGCIAACAPGGRVVLFAGFGDHPHARVDLNVLHYREIALVGSEWVGTPPNQRREHYGEACALIASGAIPVERLVTGTCGLDGLAEAFADVRARRGLKTVLVP